jgi:hypothetical protein
VTEEGTILRFMRDKLNVKSKYGRTNMADAVMIREMTHHVNTNARRDSTW